MSSVKLSDSWRTTTFRLVLLYGFAFGLSVIALVTLIYFHTARYINQQIDQVLQAESHSCHVIPSSEVPRFIASTLKLDVRKIEIFGLFSPQGEYLSGNARHLPGGMVWDGRPRSIRVDQRVIGKSGETSIRALVTILPDQNILLVGREERQIGEIRNIILEALAGAAGIIVLVTLVGVRLSLVPIRRIREVQAISQAVRDGEIGHRFPVSQRNDELDMLARIVNEMLDDTEHRMRDIKGTSDSIAHNLRTPLTRLRALLNRLTHLTEGTGANTVAIQATEEVDQLLSRFRALLRVSEISGSMRQEAFGEVDLASVLKNIHDAYSPVAEERDIELTLELPSISVGKVLGDASLLFEALLNLVDNAIKFAPDGGRVHLSLGAGPVVSVEDNGPGISPDEIHLITQPFYRGGAGRSVPGSGVGLSIVAAIASLHGFDFELTSEPGKTKSALYCFKR